MQIMNTKTLRVSGHIVRLFIWVSAAIVLRAAFFFTFPAFITNDSWDYLRVAEDLYHRLDFFSPGLRDVRLPGYPAFLALTYPLTGMQSDRIVLAQLVLGMATVALGYLVGRQLRSRAVAEILVIFLGLNPIYIFMEHALMTETLFLVSLLAVVTVALAGLYRRYTWFEGILLGVLIGLSTLIRVNVLPFCLVLVAGVLIFQLNVSVKNTSFISGVKAMGLTIVIVASAVLLTLLPWLARNVSAYGTPSMVNFGNRNILIFATMHEQLDYSLPTIAEVNKQLDAAIVDWDWLWKAARTFGTHGAEEVAREILIEQFSNHPDQYVANVLDGLSGFGGIQATIGDERTAVLSWVEWQMDATKLNHEASVLDTSVRNLEFQYVATGSDSAFNRAFQTAASAYLRFVRPLLYVAGLGAWIVFIVVLFVRRRLAEPEDVRSVAVAVVGGAYAANLLVHALTMIDGDRIALPFDWVLVLMLTLMSEVWVERLRRDTG